MITCSQCGITISNPVYYLSPENQELKRFYATQTKERYCSAQCSTLRTDKLRRNLDADQISKQR